MLDGLSFFKLASQRLSWLSARQKVVSENIANADTPAYKARDVTPFDAMVKGTRTGLATTASGHIGGGAMGGTLSVRPDETGWETSLDGNTVVLEQQTVKASEISEQYKLATQLYRKGHELLALSATGLR
ncbi:flagellar basal body protein [Limimaricola pyoseonensis]|uniref:Flagellar basal body rod protein FlgB n=1 Tax=Limimaricola pyoseonensis TaxID=521013 RepID=A0A1G7KDH2_9RHOB|nr:flagellar basal body protein [Limimaricola pyoseonensis]SDF35205.1 flagellar basal-body rod protein FlgB [Limimaricola pyoseonensis]